MAQNQKQPKGGKNMTTSETRKHKYASYAMGRVRKQLPHTACGKRSPLVRSNQRRVAIAEYVNNYNYMIKSAENNDTLPLALPFDPSTIRMLREAGVSKEQVRIMRAMTAE